MNIDEKFLSDLASTIVGKPTTVTMADPTRFRHIGVWGDCTQPKRGQFAIRLSTRLLEPEYAWAFDQVFYHELCHALNGDPSPLEEPEPVVTGEQLKGLLDRLKVEVELMEIVADDYAERWQRQSRSLLGYSLLERASQ